MLNKCGDGLGSSSLHAIRLFVPFLGHPKLVHLCHFLGMKEKDLCSIGLLSRPVTVMTIQTSLVCILS